MGFYPETGDPQIPWISLEIYEKLLRETGVSEDVEKCLASGMNDHLGKPLDFDEVLEKPQSNLLNKKD